MKLKKLYDDPNCRNIFFAMIVFAITLSITLVIRYCNLIPSFGGNATLQGICENVIRILIFISAMGVMLTTIILVGNILAEYIERQNLNNGLKTAQNELTSDYTTVKINETIALGWILDHSDIECKAKLKDGKVFLTVKVDAEKEIKPQVFAEDFNIPT